MVDYYCDIVHDFIVFRYPSQVDKKLDPKKRGVDDCSRIFEKLRTILVNWRRWSRLAETRVVSEHRRRQTYA